jgi:hypothetical protein
LPSCQWTAVSGIWHLLSADDGRSGDVLHLVKQAAALQLIRLNPFFYNLARKQSKKKAEPPHRPRVSNQAGCSWQQPYTMAVSRRRSFLKSSWQQPYYVQHSLLSESLDAMAHYDGGVAWQVKGLFNPLIAHGQWRCRCGSTQ